MTQILSLNLLLFPIFLLKETFSPVLFIIFIIEMGKSLNIINNSLYADDTSIFIESNTMSVLYAQGNFVMSSSYKWFIANYLTVNVDRTFFYNFH